MIMKVYRFIFRAYPSETHTEFYGWQKSTLVLFIADFDPYAAEQKALNELKARNWIPESFELRDTLIRDAVLAQGGEVWDAYLQAESKGIFFMEELDSLPLCKKGEKLWGTGPRLTEKFVDNLIEESGGHRVTREEAGGFLEKNADYILGKYVLELKHLENEGLLVESRQKKIGELFKRYLSEGSVHQIDPYKLSEQDFKEYWEIIGVPIQRSIKTASKQVKATIAHLGQDKFEGGVILLNTGYLTVPHDFLVAMAERYAAKDTSSIGNVIVISSWTITNGFDTVVNYGFHPHESDCSDLHKLSDTFWATVTKLMTQMITGELDPERGAQEPMSPVYFNHEGEMFTFGIPQLESSVTRKKDWGSKP
jgi:hypothetical protein